MQVWTASNLLSFARVAIGIYAGGWLLVDPAAHRAEVLALMVIAALTDFLDGLLARSLHQVTELGKMIDPLADKISIGFVAVVLAAQGRIPLWFLGLALIRDASILAAGIYLHRARRITLQSNAWGKWAAGALAAYLFVVVLDLPSMELLNSALLACGVALLLVSSSLYIIRFSRVIRTAAPEAGSVKR